MKAKLRIYVGLASTEFSWKSEGSTRTAGLQWQRGKAITWLTLELGLAHGVQIVFVT